MSINIFLTDLAKITHLGVASDAKSGYLMKQKSMKYGLANYSSQAKSGLSHIFVQLMS